MRTWFLLILFGSLLVQTLSRPQQAEYNNDSDLDEAEEEDDNEAAAEELIADDEESRLNEQEPAVQEEEVPRSRHLLDLTESRYLQRTSADDRLAPTKTENLSDPKNGQARDTRDENAKYNDQSPRAFPRRRQSNRYIEGSDDQQEATQHLTNRDVKSNRIVQNQGDNQIYKRTIEYEQGANEEGDMLFEKNKDQVSKVDKSEYNHNEPVESNEQSRYFKEYYNTMQSDARDMSDDKSHDSARFNLRDRREAKDSSQGETNNMSSNQGSKESNDKTDSEDEESAIKRHIKKLSGDELDQLLSSLTDEKRELLKKIIDDVDAGDNGYINKREITKKAGAVEEINFIENCQSDLSKVQGGSPVADTESSASPNTETTESSKPSESQTESGEVSSAKSSESSISSLSKIDLTNRNDDAVQKKSDINTLALNMDPKTQGENVANVQATSKTENKRETNLEDFEAMNLDDSKNLDNELNLQSDQDYSNEQGYFCSQDESLSKLMEDGTQLNDENKQAYKREAYFDNNSDLSDSIKSLEESFPNSNAYDDSVPYSGPLVRVKRKNTDRVIKKRSAALMPDAKVAYFPYKAENDDEDNDEGNEFDDEGFYDRTSNFANGNKGLEDKTDVETSAKNMNVDNSKLSHENVEGDTMSLGSDTDSVLSGVEGVDDNLMYSSGTRNRRTSDDNAAGPTGMKSDRSPSLAEDEMKAPETYFSAPNYQENDAFGPLPRSYDGDLARYKRIRRVKQSHSAPEVASADG